jgi:hypothetical protein
MKATSTWSIAPELAEAMSQGMTPEEWIGGRRPVCSYARIGEDEQESVGVERQHLDNGTTAPHQGLAIVAHYTDNHLTAADPAARRPAFLRMIQDLRARRTAEGVPVVGIIAVAADRVYRLPLDRRRTHLALTVDDQGCFYAVDEQRYVTPSPGPHPAGPVPGTDREDDEVPGSGTVRPARYGTEPGRASSRVATGDSAGSRGTSPWGGRTITKLIRSSPSTSAR